MFKTKTKSQKGFTLIELLVVIAIIGLLSTVAVVALQNAREKSRDARRKGDLKQVQSALELYITSPESNGLYPLEADSLECFETASNLQTAIVTGKFMVSLPKDPLYISHGYCYRYRSDNGGEFKITTQLEDDIDLMASDGGITDSLYEVFTPGAQAY